MKRITMIVAVAIGIFGMVTANGRAATIPYQINYQGVLKDTAGAKVDGTVDIDLRLLPLGGGAAVFSESHTGVSVVGGLFSLKIGGVSDMSAVSFDTAYELELTVDGDLLSPNTPLCSAPYALGVVGGAQGPQGKQGPAGAAGGTGAQGPAGAAGGTGAQGPAGAAGGTGAQGPQGKQGPAGAGAAPDTDWIIGGGSIYNTTDNVGVGVISPDTKFDVRGDTRVGPSGRFNFHHGTEFNMESGEDMYIQYRRGDDSGGEPGDTILNLTGGNVGIGTGPSGKLHVVGATILDGTLDQSGATILDGTLDQSGTARVGPSGNFTFERSNEFNTQSGDILIQFREASSGSTSSAGNTLLNIQSGNVGIATESPDVKLDVRGDTRIGPSGRFNFHHGSEFNMESGEDMDIQYRRGDDSGGEPGDTILNRTGGNVGIGTAPSGKLHVAGATILDGTLDQSGTARVGPSGNFTFERGNEFNTQSGDILIQFREASSGSTSSAGNTLLNIQSGNVGIATGSPDVKLDVRGDTRIGPGGRFNFHNTNEFNMEGGEDMYIQYRRGDHAAGSAGDTVLNASSGNVGIGRAPSTNKFEVEGDASKSTAGDWLANSDRRIKTDIQDIENAADTISRLHPVKFKYNRAYMAAHPSVEDRYYYNYVAQEFQEVFPESVLEDAEGVLMMDGHAANIVAIKAIQELIGQNQVQQQLIEALQAEVQQLKQQP